MVTLLALFLACPAPAPPGPAVHADSPPGDSAQDSSADSADDSAPDSPDDSGPGDNPVGLTLIGDDVLHYAATMHTLERHLAGTISDSGALTATYTYTFALDEDVVCDGALELSGVADDARCPDCDWVFDLEITSESRADTDRCTLEAWQTLDSVDGFDDFAFAFTPDYNYERYYYRGDLMIRGSRDAFLVGAEWTDPADASADPVSSWAVWADARSDATMVRSDPSLTFDESSTDLWYDWAWFAYCDTTGDDRYVLVEDASRASGSVPCLTGAELLADVYTFEAQAGEEISVIATGSEAVSLILGEPSGCATSYSGQGDVVHVAEASGEFTLELMGVCSGAVLTYDLAVGIVPP